MQGLGEQQTRSKELEGKRSILGRQIALLAERIGQLPEAIDPKPLIDQLGELQQVQVKINNDLKQISQQSDPEARPVSFESLEIFRLGLKDLVMKGENDLQMRSAIIKIIVHKIEIMKDGFEIHFHVGQTHFETALGDYSSSASFFVSKTVGLNQRVSKMKKPSEGHPSEGFNLLSSEEDSKSQASRILRCDRSKRLTLGGAVGPIGNKPNPT